MTVKHNRIDDPEIMKQFKEFVLSGLPRSIAATRAGLSKHTVCKWWNAGEIYLDKLHEGETLTQDQERIVEWYIDVSPGWAEHISSLYLEVLKENDPKRAKSRLLLLEKLLPSELGVKNNIWTENKHSEEDKQKLPFEERLRLIAQILQDKDLLIQICNQDNGSVKKIFGEVLRSPQLTESGQS